VKPILSSLATLSILAGLLVGAPPAVADQPCQAVGGSGSGAFTGPDGASLAYWSPSESSAPIVSAKLQVCGAANSSATYTLHGTFSNGDTFTVPAQTGSGSTVTWAYQTGYAPVKQTTTTKTYVEDVDSPRTTGERDEEENRDPRDDDRNDTDDVVTTTSTTWTQTNPKTVCVYATMSVAGVEVDRHPTSGSACRDYTGNSPGGYSW
jgi:hypothetical protein